MATDSDARTTKQAVVEGINLLAQGKRNLLCGEVHQAVNQLEEATKIFVHEYGELGSESADAYFLYGRALLELHRCESNVLEQGAASESDDDDDEEDDDNKGEEGEPIDEGNSQNSEESHESEDLVDEEETEQNDKANKTEILSIEKSNELNGAKNEKPAEVSDEKASNSTLEQTKVEDISNLQLSWETLELAKIIYLRQNTPESKYKLADTHFKLGDVGLEMEQFEDAIKDYKTCLEIQKSILPEDCRHIAETLYQLGVAHTLNRSYDASLDQLRSTIKVMEVRRKRLKKVADGEIPPDINEISDGFYTPVELAAKEIEELAELINEVHRKIEEVEDEKRYAPKVSELLKESITPTKQPCQGVAGVIIRQPFDGLESGKEDFPQTDAPIAVHNITHLVRKRKMTSDVPETPEKKQKLDGSVVEMPQVSE